MTVSSNSLCTRLIEKNENHYGHDKSLIRDQGFNSRLKARICAKTQELVQTPNKKLRLDSFYSNLY